MNIDKRLLSLWQEYKQWKLNSLPKEADGSVTYNPAQTLTFYDFMEWLDTEWA